MSRKPLDLSALETALQKRKSLSVDRDVQRAMLMSNHLTSGSNSFSVKEEDGQEILILSSQSLPTEEEIEKLKQELKEKDKIERDQKELQALTIKKNTSLLTKIMEFLDIRQWVLNVIKYKK